MSSSTPRVSFADGMAGGLRPSVSGDSQGPNPSSSRANSVTRRASMPVPRVSIAERSASIGSIGEAPQASAEGQKTGPMRRASVGHGMLSAPFQRTPKEAPRWRPYTFQAQQQQQLGIQSTTSSASLSSLQSESSKPLSQKIMEKSAGSLVLGLFIIGGMFCIGLVTKLILRRDLGYLGFYINQLFLITIYCIERRKDEKGEFTEVKRIDNLTPFEIGTLACQVLPFLYALLAGTYSGLVLSIILQVILKAMLMFGMNQVVEISL